MNASEVITEVHEVNGRLIADGNNIRIEAAAGTLSIDILSSVRDQKRDILQLLYAETKAKAAGWLILAPDTFSKQIDRKTDIYLLWSPKGWKAWRGTWDIEAKDSSGQKLVNKPLASQKELVAGADFDDALARAEDYISWRKNRQRKQKAA